MELSREERRLLDGSQGPGRMRAMRYLVDIGEGLGAERMTPITRAHCEIAEGVFAGGVAESFLNWPEEFLEEVDTFAVPTTINSHCIDIPRSDAAGFNQEAVAIVNKTQPKAMERMESRGGISIYSCAPLGVVPSHFGEHIAITESGVSHYANSVIGARTHHHTVGSALAAAVTGRVPLWGRHLKENRYGEVVVKFDADIDRDALDYADLGALAFWVGIKAEDKIPVWIGLNHMNYGELLYWTIAQCLMSGYDMEHAVGITPEAPTIEAAFGPNKPSEIIILDKESLKESYAYLTTASKGEIDLVVMGCPHLSIDQVLEIARMLEGKKIHQSVKFVCATNVCIRAIAERMGAVEIIENAGGVVTQDACAGPCNHACLTDITGMSTCVTNSVTAADYIPGVSGGKILAYYRNTKDCVEAAIKGRID